MKKWTRREIHPKTFPFQEFEPETPALQERCSTELSYEPIYKYEKKGGDPAAGSPTATL